MTTITYHGHISLFCAPMAQPPAGTNTDSTTHKRVLSFAGLSTTYNVSGGDVACR